ncbi:MAG: LPXTG cell wall anchor domain-containing protein [Mycobacteriales bacterium]
MPRPASAARSRRATRGAVVVAAATTLLVGGAVPASGQTAQDVAGATAATALTLTVNLPGGETTRLILSLDPVTGTVSRVSSTPEATAVAEVVSGSFGGQPLSSGASSAMLPSPLSSTSNPTGALGGGLAGTGLDNLLKLELLPSAATVSPDPSSTSTAAVANLGVGLPDDVADALAPLTDGLAAGVDQLLTALSDASGMTVPAICDGLTQAVTALAPVTGALTDALAALPIPVPVQAVLDETTLGAICGLATTLDKLNAALQGALTTLTGDSGVLGTGLINSAQSITQDGGGVTSRATASVADLTLLGQQALVGTEVLRTTSTAVAKGTAGSAKATIDSTVANLTAGKVDPFLQVRATINGIFDSFVGQGALPVELQTLFDDLFDTLNEALAPVGIVLFKNDDSPQAQALQACPTQLDGLQTGTFEAGDGTCAAAATRGVGLSVTLPEALTTALMIQGPLVELLIVPSAAVARVQATAVAGPPPATQLPRTGVDTALLGGLGAALLLGTALLRRRRHAGAAA